MVLGVGIVPGRHVGVLGMGMSRVDDPGRLAVRGHVIFTATDESGRVVAAVEADNAFTDAYASFVAQLMGSGGSPSMPLTHIGLGCGGFSIAVCDAITGWSSAPTLDTTTYKQGTGSLKATQTASTSGTYAHQTLISATDATGGTIDAWLRLTTRANTDLAASKFRVYTGGAAQGYEITLAAIEALPTGTFVDATWKAVSIPLASFSTFGASPSWAAVRGAGMVVAANAGGSATIHWDDIRQVRSTLPVDKAQTTVTDERTKHALTSLVYAAPGTVTAKAYWTSGDNAGTFRIAGLYGGTAGATLAAIVAADLSKLVGFNLTVTWTLTFAGG